MEEKIAVCAAVGNYIAKRSQPKERLLYMKNAGGSTAGFFSRENQSGS